MNKDVLNKMSMQEVLGYIDKLEETTGSLINERNKQTNNNNYVVITDVPDTLETFTMDEAIRVSQDILLTGTEKQVCIAKVFGLYEIDKPATFKFKVIE